MLSIKAKIVKEHSIQEGFLTFDNGVIVEADSHTNNDEYVDMGDCYIVPGFIDLHTHGIHRYLADNGAEDLSQICRILPRYGVTGFLPTVAPRPQGEDARFLTTLAEAKTDGAQILGFHLEGPFLRITGVLSSEAISAADAGRVESLIRAALPYKAIFSVSPDVEGIENLIPLMAANDTPVFITHTAATVQQTQRAIELGACHATHFYDVFPCPPVSEPGVRPCGAVEAILADRRVSVDFILDEVHVDPVAVQMALACKPGRVCLITDSNVGAGLEPGRFNFGSSGEIYFASKGAPARMVKDDTLAGSGLTMDQALRNAVHLLGLSIPEAAKMASACPAEVIRTDKRKGRLETGYEADFVILDNRLEVVQTWIGGKCCYHQPACEHLTRIHVNTSQGYM
jgi:N-acetylglucosamine-6-phosphate deacetylase